MLQELQRAAANEFGVKIEVCIGKKAFGFEEFPKSEEDVRKKICLRHLIGENAVIDLNRAEEKDDSLLELAKSMRGWRMLCILRMKRIWRRKRISCLLPFRICRWRRYVGGHMR